MSSTFPGPVGLALAGGGSHGAWQAGALGALTAAGLEFEKVVGFSAGALCGAAYALDRQDLLPERWRSISRERVLRFSPRRNPLSLFSEEPLWETVAYAADEARAKQALRRELTVISLRIPQGEYDYARFVPGGAWDGPLATKLVASCAIPRVFPNVIHRAPGAPPQRLVDGGVPGNGWIRFDVLAGCRSVVALQMTRPDEIGTFRFWPWSRIDQKAREICYRQMASGIGSLLEREDPPEVYRLYPSRALEPLQLSFQARACAAAMELGEEDGRGFMSDPERWRAMGGGGEVLR